MLKLWIILACLSFEPVIRANDLEQTECSKLETNNCRKANLTYWLYSTANPTGRELPDLGVGGFKLKKQLKVLIHGYAGNRTTTPMPELIPELLRYQGVDVIAIDYSSLVPDPCYTESAHNSRQVGYCLGLYLASLTYLRVGSLADLHMIGYGLGAHVAGFAANYLAKFRIATQRISAIDPAKPLFLTNNLTQRLDANDAKFVDVLHSDIFMHGIMQSIGHVDFFPNMGATQPNCGPPDEFETHACYHRRGAEYYAESIRSKQGFWAFRCADLYSFLKNECQPNADQVQMGYHTQPSARGNYFLGTNPSPPYARGRDFSNLDRSIYGKTYLGDSFLDKLKEMGPGVRELVTNI